MPISFIGIKRIRGGRMEGELKINYKKLLKFSVVMIVILISVLISVKLALFFLPFVIAYIVSKIIKKPVDFLARKFKMPRILAVIFSMIGFIGIVGAICYFFVAAVIREVIALSSQTNYIFPMLYNNISIQVGRFTFFYQNLELSPELIAGIQDTVLNIFNTLLTTVSGFINSAGNWAVNLVVNLPNVLIYIIITLLATFFITYDHKFILDSLEKHLPLKWLVKVQDILDGLFSALGGYLKAQGILITITYCELLIGLSIFKIDYALILALVIAIIDALPILGTGTVLIPWGIISLIMGNYPLGFGILGLYLFILIVRQLIEPKIVGTQIGVYPLLTLIAMYTGVKLIGVFGVIVGPVVLIILKNVFAGIYSRGMLKEIFDGKN